MANDDFPLHRNLPDRFDLLVVGVGIARVRAALCLRDRFLVGLISKEADRFLQAIGPTAGSQPRSPLTHSLLECLVFAAQRAKEEGRRTGNEQEGTRNEEYRKVGDKISNFTIEILEN